MRALQKAGGCGRVTTGVTALAGLALCGLSTAALAQPEPRPANPPQFGPSLPGDGRTGAETPGPRALEAARAELAFIQAEGLRAAAARAERAEVLRLAQARLAQTGAQPGAARNNAVAPPDLAQNPADQAAQLQTAAAAVKAAEERLALATKRFQAGVSTLVEVDQAQVDVAEAHIRWIQLQDQPRAAVEPQVIAELGKLVQSQADAVALATARYKAGAATLAEVNTVRIKLSQARIRLELHTLVALCAENLAAVQVRFKAGLCTQDEVTAATESLAAARALLEHSETGLASLLPPDARPQD